jgi:hydroxyacylglutathione hydrolase
MRMLQIHQFPCLDDNYGFLAHDPATGATAAVDTPDAERYLAEAAAKGWRITDVWNTHWHQDHAGGNAAIKAATGAIVTGPAEVARIGTPADRVVQGGDEVRLGGLTARVLDVGGHTLGHIAYVFDADRVAFVGDSLFALGCGRMFEGDARQMWASLSRLAALPDDFAVYCAHEYTASNARFALSVDGANPALVAYADEVTRKRAAGLPTVPTTIGAERAANPFLRAPALKSGLGIADDAEAFGVLRGLKDNFR